MSILFFTIQELRDGLVVCATYTLNCTVASVIQSISVMFKHVRSVSGEDYAEWSWLALLY